MLKVIPLLFMWVVGLHQWSTASFVSNSGKRCRLYSLSSSSYFGGKRNNSYHHRFQHCSSKLFASQNNNDDLNNHKNDDTSGQRKTTMYETKMKELIDASTLSLAPMMEYTDRHFRHLVRLISAKTLLYTEMVGASALYHEQLDSKLRYQQEYPTATQEEIKTNYDTTYLHRFIGQGQIEPLEGPSVLQLGGSDPQIMYESAKTILELTERGNICDYTAINLNCGCPSPKVAGKGCFGAALMDEPKLVSELTKELSKGCNGQLPITVKCRIGTDTERTFNKLNYAEIDEEEEYQKLCNFIETVASNGIVKCFDVHARIAVLKKSFSPADNRKIPPLKYHFIHRLVQDYPELHFVLNGGIESISQANELLEQYPGLQGVMIGRAWAADPWRFAMADQLLYKSNETPIAQNRLQVLKEYGKHADAEEAKGDPVKIRRFIVKAITPLFAGEPRAKQYRVALDQLATIPKKLVAEGKDLSNSPPISELIINTALEHLSEETLLRTPEESYERFLLQQQKQQASGGNSISMNGSATSTSQSVVADWQAHRKMEQSSNNTENNDETNNYDVTSTEETSEAQQQEAI